MEERGDLMKQENAEGISNFSFAELLLVSDLPHQWSYNMFNQFSILALSFHDIQNTNALLITNCNFLLCPFHGEILYILTFPSK